MTPNHGHRVMGMAFGHDTIDETYCEECREWRPTQGFTTHMRERHPFHAAMAHYTAMAAEAQGVAR